MYIDSDSTQPGRRWFSPGDTPGNACSWLLIRQNGNATCGWVPHRQKKKGMSAKLEQRDETADHSSSKIRFIVSNNSKHQQQQQQQQQQHQQEQHQKHKDTAKKMAKASKNHRRRQDAETVERGRSHLVATCMLAVDMMRLFFCFHNRGLSGYSTHTKCIHVFSFCTMNIQARVVAEICATHKAG